MQGVTYRARMRGASAITQEGPLDAVGPTIVIIGDTTAVRELIDEIGNQSHLRVLWCKHARDLRSFLEAIGRAPAPSAECSAFPSTAAPDEVGPQPDSFDSEIFRVFNLGPASIDVLSGKLVGPKGGVQLTSTELRLIEYLYHADGPRAAKRIATELFQRTDFGGENLVHKHIGNVRAKLARVGAFPQPVERLALGYSLHRSARRE
jgi:hypothetical protein